MSLFALALVLAAAGCHATWNLLVKRVAGGPELVWLFSAVSVLLYLPLAVGVIVIETPDLGWYELGACLISALLHMAYFLLLQQGYRRGDLSLVYPTARATGPLLSTVFAVLVLGEVLTPAVATGGLAIVIGVVFLTGGFNRRAEHVRESLVFGLLAGTLIASYTVFDAQVVRALLVPPLLLDYASSLTRATLLAPVAARRWATVKTQWREHRWAVLGIAVFNPLAYILVLTALTVAPVVYVAPAREVSVLLTVVLGSVLLGEGDLRRRLGWAGLILVGMTVLALG